MDISTVADELASTIAQGVFSGIGLSVIVFGGIACLIWFMDYCFKLERENRQLKKIMKSNKSDNK